MDPLLLGTLVAFATILVLFSGVSGALGLLIVSAAILVTGYLADLVPWRICIMFAAPIIQLAVYKRMLKRGITSRDCVSLTWLGVLLLVTYHLWVFWELPGARGL